MGIVKYNHIENPTGLIVIENGKPVLKAYRDGVQFGACTRNTIHVEENLNDNDWDTIRTVCEWGDAPNYWAVGDEKTDVGVDGVTRTFRIADMQGLYGKQVVFEEKDTESSSECYNWDTRDDDNTLNNYSVCVVPSKLERYYLTKYSEELQSKITKTKVKTAKNGMSSTMIETEDFLFLPAEREMFSSRTGSVQTEFDALIQYQYYALHSTNDDRKKVMIDTTSLQSYWLRSPLSGTDNMACKVGTAGERSQSIVTQVYRYSPCFAF